MVELDKTYNNSRPPLTDIVCFSPLRISVSLTILKCVYTFIRNISFLSSADARPHNLPVRAQFPLQPMWDFIIHSLGDLALLLAHCPMSSSDTMSNNPSPLALTVTYHCQPHDFKTRLLGKGFHTRINNISLWDLIIHPP